MQSSPELQEGRVDITRSVSCVAVDGKVIDSREADANTPFYTGSVSKPFIVLGALRCFRENAIDTQNIEIPYTTKSKSEIKALAEIRRRNVEVPGMRSTLMGIAGDVATELRSILPLRPMSTILTLQEAMDLTVGYSGNDSLRALINYMNIQYFESATGAFQTYVQEQTESLLKSRGIDEPKISFRGVDTGRPANTASLREVSELFRAIGENSSELFGVSLDDLKMLQRSLGITAYPGIEMTDRDFPSAWKVYGKFGEFRIRAADEDNSQLTRNLSGVEKWNVEMSGYDNLMYAGYVTNGEKVIPFVYALANPAMFEIPEDLTRFSNDVPQYFLRLVSDEFNHIVRERVMRVAKGTANGMDSLKVDEVGDAVNEMPIYRSNQTG